MTFRAASGGGSGPFERYPAPAGTVWSAGDAVQAYGAQVDGVQDGVTAAHRPAQLAVAGLLAGPMAAAPQPVRTRAVEWMQSAVFGGAAVRLFGDGVHAYDRGIDDLNARYWAAKASSFGVSRPSLPAGATDADRRAAEDGYRGAVAAADAALLAALRRERDLVLEPALDDSATQVAGLLDRGPGDAGAVLALYQASALPWTAPALFPAFDFGPVPPPLGGPDGQRAAELVRQALAGDASPEELREAMLMLQSVTEHARYVQEHGGHLTEDTVAFLSAFYNGLGDKVWDVPGYVRADEHHWDAAAVNPFGWFDKDADGYDDATQAWMLGAMGTGLLALSNNQLWDPALRASDPMDTGARYHLPQTVVDLVRDPDVHYDIQVIGTQAYQVFDLPRRDDLLALAEMMRATDDGMVAGRDFSAQLTLRMAEIAVPVQHFTDWSPSTPGVPPLVGDDGLFLDDADGLMRTLLDVSTRNDEANYDILTNRVQHPLYGDQTNRQVLSALYHFDWSDEGRQAAGLTDWIGERADAAHQRNQEDRMANEVTAALVDVVTTTQRGEGHESPDEYRADMYDDLMRTLADKNPEVARSFSRVAASYLTDFSEPSGAVTTVEGDGSLSLSDHDKIRFLDLVATDDRAVNGLSYAAGQYEQRLLTAGLDNAVPMTEVGQRSERLDGLLAAARVNATTVGSSQELADANAAYAEHMRYAELGKSAVTTILGEGMNATPLKPVAPYFSAGLGAAADQIIDGLLPEPTPDHGFHPGDINDQGRDDTYAAYDYLTALNAAGRVPADQIPDFMIETAPVYPGGPSGPVYHDGHPVLRPVHELTGGERQALVNLLGNEDTGIGGPEFEAYRDNYNAYTSYSQAAAESLDEAEAHRQGGDD